MTNTSTPEPPPRELTTFEADEVNRLTSNALWYAWGRQDAGNSGVDTWTFGHTYGAYAARYIRGELGSRMPIQEAYARYRETDAIAPRESD